MTTIIMYYIITKSVCETVVGHAFSFGRCCRTGPMTIPISLSTLLWRIESDREIKENEGNYNETFMSFLCNIVVFDGQTFPCQLNYIFFFYFFFFPATVLCRLKTNNKWLTIKNYQLFHFFFFHFLFADKSVSIIFFAYWTNRRHIHTRQDIGCCSDVHWPCAGIFITRLLCAANEVNHWTFFFHFFRSHHLFYFAWLNLFDSNEQTAVQK